MNSLHPSTHAGLDITNPLVSADTLRSQPLPIKIQFTIDPRVNAKRYPKNEQEK
jgi:hypothetical protein